MFGCAQPDGSSGSAVGVDLGGRLDSGIYHTDTMTTIRYPDGASDFLYVGSAHDMTSETLIRFYKPAVDSTFVVDSARIELHYGGGYSDGDIGSLRGEWINYTLTAIPPNLEELPAGDLLDLHIEETATDSGKVTIPLTVEAVTEWLLPDTTGSDSTTSFDVAIRIAAPDALNKLIRIRSGASDTLRPKLYIYSTSLDTLGQPVIDSLSIIPQVKMSLITNNMIPTENQVVVGDGAIMLSLLRFDISDLTDELASSNIIVNRAVLTLYRDKSLYPWGVYKKSISLRIQKLTSDTWLTDDSLWMADPEISGYPFNTATVDSSADSVEFVVTYPSTDWVGDIEKNFGILLQPYNTQINPSRKGIDIERVAFHAPDDPDPTLRPKLKVYYTEFIR